MRDRAQQRRHAQWAARARVTLPSMRSASLSSAESAPGRVSTSTGRSDQGGCSARMPRAVAIARRRQRLLRGSGRPPRRREARAPGRRGPGTVSASMPRLGEQRLRWSRRPCWSAPAPAPAGPGRPVVTLMTPAAGSCGAGWRLRRPGTPVRMPRKSRSGVADVDPAAAHVRTRGCVRSCAAAALLHHRDRLPHLAPGLEVAQQDHRVGQVAGVDRRVHLRRRSAPWCAPIRMVATPCWPRYVSSSCSWMVRKRSSGIALR